LCQLSSQSMLASLEVMLLPAVVSAVAAPTEGSATLPVADNAVLTSGFDYNNGARVPAVELPGPCSSASTSDACVEVLEDEHVTSYTRNVQSRADHSNLMSSITEAEGGGFGITVSTGVTAVKQSQTSEASWSFFVGKSEIKEHHVIHNPLKLKLVPAARELLQANPLGFLETYGQHYIYSITYGGSFLGYFSMTERQSRTTSDLEVFAEVDASRLFFSADASTDFQMKSSAASSRVESQANVNYVGGKNVKTDTSSPFALGNMFSDWEQSMETSPAALTMTLRSWMDCEEVQEIVNSMPAEVQDAFRVQPIADTTADTLSEENGKMLLLAASVQQALQWTEVATNTTLRNQLRGLESRVKAHATSLQTLSEADVLYRQAEIKAADLSWFIADDMTDEFEDIKARLPPPPVMQIVNPTSGKCLDLDGSGYFQDTTKAQLWTCLGNPNQQWELRQGQVVNPLSGKCLDLDGAGEFQDGTKAQLFTCLGNSNQQWEFRDGQLVNPPSGKCLDLDGDGHFQDGTQAQLWTCLGNPNQKWELRQATELLV